MSDVPVLPPNDEDDERLDALIRRAHRTEVDPQTIERLRLAWHGEMDRGRPLRLWLPLAAAACLAAVAGTLALTAVGPREVAEGTAKRGHGGDGASPDTQQDGPAQPIPPSPRVADGNAVTRDAAAGAGPPPETRELTAYQRLLAQTALVRKGANTDGDALALRRRLVEQLTQLKDIDDRTAVELAADLGVSLATLEQELARLSLALRGPRREKAIELFGRAATSIESLPALLQLWNQGRYQAHVVPALAHLAEADALAACYLQAASPGVRTSVANALVARLGEGDGRLLVELITRSPRPDELLAAVRTVDGPLFTALFRELDAESRSVRYAAARSLGALNQVEITRRLIEHVETGHRRQEALVALAASREPAAVEFVARARGNPVLATAIQSALVHSSISQPWYGG